MTSEREPFYITQSKKMCKESGMDPNEIASPKRFMTNQELDVKRKAYSEILSVVSYFSNKLLDALKGTPILISVSDSKGYLLDMVGDETIKSTVEEFGIKLGSLFTQEDTGTNVISLTLQQRHPVQLIGKDHYHTFLSEIACYGAPFHYTDEDSLLGSVSIMMPVNFCNPLFLTMLSQVVDSIERELLLRKQNRTLNILNQIMLSRANNGIIITDEKGIIVEFNDFAQQIFNESRSYVIGKSIYHSILTGDYFKRVLVYQEKQENVELKFKNKNGDLVVCLFDAQPIYEGEKMIGTFGQYRDITERYLLDEKIKESEKQALAGQIAAGIAHEIRNPLTTVRGYLQILGSDVDDNIAHIFSGLLIPEIDRANKIISDFLRITKPSDKELEVIQIHKFLIDYLWEFLKSESLLYNADLNVEILPATKYLSILCNRGELLQVFINLFQNSLQAKGNSPLKINISTRLVNSHVQFIFSDNGKGIDATTLAHIFEPFFSTKDTGTGLGLSVSRKIVENHRGTMHASSNENGTEFFIELPVYN
ncbi:PAS domain-containing protein [Bacillus sp. ISL-40]|uniref:ATP-binding protein n=1 Tax=unclassified Bacillus (in: firmicutes) TaxID=185979 RepID=UPI001BE868AF|nr:MULTISPECIES: ATP-binding protein [unclassified Bacillus (in: firmicutes)]MBT2699894.1 PAS domain-containing protein [Bacillus sp. ISL-40]MBT2722913.1 PAS domain-containing protein [Bacillus sp. ISL-46]MBT2743801.1 PAS domain-containing protein [Bacillus sp. ISL-77]